MKKTEEYIKPVILDSLTINPEEVQQIKDYYNNLKNSGELGKLLSRIMRKQKKATTTNGPHPHHLPSTITSAGPSS
jgi:hypothetical protein